MSLTLAQIRTFLSIVHRGTFAAAAVELGVTQPSVSQRIRELESTLDSRLFHRNGPRIRLTRSGEALVPYADRLLAAAEDILDDFRTGDPLSGMLRMGVTDSFAMIALSDLLRRLAEQHPRLKTSVRVDDASNLQRLLENGDVDIAIGPLVNTGPGIARESLGHNVLAWFGAPRMGITPGVLTPGDLAQHHLMCAGPPSRLYQTAIGWFAGSGIEPQQLSTCNSLDVTMRAVLSGHAIGLLPIGVMRAHLREGRARRLALEPPFPGHEFVICYPKNDPVPSVRAVVDFSREVVAAHELYG